jgi:hypothetical protein
MGDLGSHYKRAISTTTHEDLQVTEHNRSFYCSLHQGLECEASTSSVPLENEK